MAIPGSLDGKLADLDGMESSSCLPVLESWPISDEALDLAIRPDVFMAMDMRENHTFGCSFYSSQTRELLLLEDMTITDQTVVESLLLSIQPTVVLILIRASPALASTLHELNCFSQRRKRCCSFMADESLLKMPS
jgi:hypothetical protein